MDVKTCTRCKKEKPLSEYYKIANGVDGVRPRCKECTTELYREKYAKDEALRWSKTSAYYKRLEESPELKARHRLKQRKWHLKITYGLSLEDFNAILENQGGGCAICGNSPDGSCGSRMVVDHCHKTNTVRGILCDLCNTALGKFHDNIGKLEKAIDYLRKNG